MPDLLPVPYPADTRAKGWRFELDMEKIKASETWLRSKSGAVKGALLLLWAESWQQEPCGSLPNDDELIALLIDMPGAAFTKCRPVLMRGWYAAEDGRLYHPTVGARVLEMLDYRKKNADRVAKFKAAKREQQGGNALPPSESPAKNDTGTGTGTGTIESQNPLPASLSAPPADAGPPKANRGSKRCPESFVVSRELFDAMAAECPAVNLERELVRFRDFTFRTPKTDWPATFRNWVREAADRAKPQRSHLDAKAAENGKWVKGTSLDRSANFDLEDFDAQRAIRA